MEVDTQKRNWIQKRHLCYPWSHKLNSRVGGVCERLLPSTFMGFHELWRRAKETEREREMDRRKLYVLTIFVTLSVRCGCVANYTRDDFPHDFAFGSGTSAYQVRNNNISFFSINLSTEEEMFVWSLQSGKELMMRTGKSLASGTLTFTLVTLSFSFHTFGL